VARLSKTDKIVVQEREIGRSKKASFNNVTCDFFMFYEPKQWLNESTISETETTVIQYCA